MKTLVFVLLLFSTTTAAAQTATEKWVNVPQGDLAALRQAMSDAYYGDPNLMTVIHTGGTFSFTGAVSGLPQVRTHVIIEGDSDPITFVGAGEEFANLLMVQADGWLRLQNIELKDFSLGLDRDRDGVYIDQSLIINHGKLELMQMQIDSLNASSFRFPPLVYEYAPIIKNTASGELYLHRVSMINSGTRLDGGVIFNDGIVEMLDTQFYYSTGEWWGTPFLNNRYMSMTNISMFHSSSAGSGAVKSNPEVETYLSNSIISGFGGGTCSYITSLGHNLIDNENCSFNAEGDMISNPVGLSWRPVEADGVTWRHRYLPPILTHALVPFASSPAVDSIDPALCTTGNLLSYTGRSVDGNVDGVALCDRGAVELQPSTLVNGGINGVYYDPGADGHYITILDNPYNTLVMWNSFDKDGNQYFVTGTGDLEMGRSLVADAYTTISGGTSADGEILPAQAVHWGTLVVDMISCNEGTLAFHSDFPEIGSGQVNLVRLAYVKQLGCVD